MANSPALDDAPPPAEEEPASPGMELEDLYAAEEDTATPDHVQADRPGGFYGVDHTSGDVRVRGRFMRGRRGVCGYADEDLADIFIKKALGGLTGEQAIDMLQQRRTMDYGDHAAKVRRTTHAIVPTFHLDMFCVIGRVLQPITHEAGFFDTIQLTFQHWHADYASKHAVKLLDFPLAGRTFHLATGPGRLCWHVVMHPREAQGVPVLRDEVGRSHVPGLARRTALQRHHAEALHDYILGVFLGPQLVGEGVEASWTLGSRHSRAISCAVWSLFQARFVEGWPAFRQGLARVDEFWRWNEPAFHAYDHGANTEIRIAQDFADAVPREVTMRRPDEVPFRASSPYGGPGSEAGTPQGEEGELASQLGEEGPYASQPPRPPRGASVLSSDPATPEPSLPDPTPQAVPGGLGTLYADLVSQYRLEGIDYVAVAVAANLNCWRLDAAGGTWAMLADRRALAAEFGPGAGFTFFPMAFHPRFGNFSAACPPRFLEPLLDVLADNARLRAGGADVLRFGHFQGYSNIKRTIRPRPNDLLAAQGIATAALALPPEEARAAGPAVERQRQRLLGRLALASEGAEPGATRPFSREKARVRHAVEAGDVAFRMEQVFAVRTSALVESGDFMAVVGPILQLIRFFLTERGSYEPLLRGFPIAIFPGVLEAFAGLFDVAVREMEDRHRLAGTAGLSLADAEGLALIDRLGNYCFTGDPRVLPGRVLRPLRTMQSLQSGAWPYFDPHVLDLRNRLSRIDLACWPQDGQGVHLLLHIASLRFHYTISVAAARLSHMRFRVLRQTALTCYASAAPFICALFQGDWQRQMVAFLVPQLRRTLGAWARAEGGGEEAGLIDAEIQQWRDSPMPFAARYVPDPPSD